MDDIRARLMAALAGSFEFERELGGGGMSRTYLMREVALQRRVVVKVLAPELLAGISVERFRREVLLAAQLQHPHVVPVLTTGDVDGIPWFTMPYVDGDSLRHRMDRGGLAIGEAVGILRDVARALAYAHAQGVVHRDIKPDNVLLSLGSATVTDFGIAKAINAARTDGSQKREALTQVGTSIGTPTYMAPEQAAGDPDTDHRADLYAFGVMAFEMLAGRTPFVASTPTRLLAAHMSEPPPDLLALRTDCPPSLAALVMRCLQKDPESRPRDSGELLQVLDSVTSSGSGAVVPEILRGGPIRLGRAVALWALATALVSLTAWAAREVIGLPDWVFPGAVGLMLAGLPVLLFTAYVQRTALHAFTVTPGHVDARPGTMANLAMKASPHVSWRRAWLGGAVAVGGFALLVIGFMVMRAMGIGPMASLKGQGTFGNHEILMVADFRSPESDPTLGRTVAEALRTDLAQSSSLNVLTRSDIREHLTLMLRSPDEPVPFDLAVQIATREGAKAVLDGSITRIGTNYLITARLTSALQNEDLASFRIEAAGDDELLPALGRLSKEIRTRAGESLRAIRASDALERVTTPSLPALRKYVDGMREADEMGDAQRGIALLREAVALDTAFAMAWRKLAVLLGRQGLDRTGMMEAVSTAYSHRDRLTEMERLLTEGLYFTHGPSPNERKALAAYEEAIKLDTLSGTALNNAAGIHSDLGNHEKAEEYFRRVVSLPQTFGGAFTNLLNQQIYNDRPAAALDSTVELFRETFGESNDFWEGPLLAAWGKGDLEATDSISRAVFESATTHRQSARSSEILSELLEMRGQPGESASWATRLSQADHEASPGPRSSWGFISDTLYFAANYGSRETTLAVLERAMKRVPLSELEPVDRPWYGLMWVGARIQDPALVRQAIAGWERDQSATSVDPVGYRAFNALQLARAEGRWSDMLRSIDSAAARSMIQGRFADVMRGMAYQSLGQVDSAITAFERFIASREPALTTDAAYRADVLQRLGELHEAKGNRTEAIDYYSRFTELWADADPALQPRVREVRERIARLQQEIG